VWNLIGMATYVNQVTMDAATLAAMPVEQQGLYDNIPVWVTSAYAIAVTAGVLSSALLLMRSTWAVVGFTISLLGACLQMLYSLLMTDAIAIIGPSVVIGPILIIAAGVALLYYSRKVRQRGWLSR
jgi:uncharacterized membrane protein